MTTRKSKNRSGNDWEESRNNPHLAVGHEDLVLVDQKTGEIKEIHSRNGFNTERQRKHFTEPTRTQQHFADACDIHKIVERHKNGEIIGWVNPNTPRYGDFTNASDYLDAVTAVKAAQEEFMALPASLRQYCQNDPGKLLELASDPNTALDLIELGGKEIVEYLHGPTEAIQNSPQNRPETEAPAVAPSTPPEGEKTPES